MKKRIAALLAIVLLLALTLAPAASAAYADGTYTVPVSIEGLGRHNVLWSSATLHVEGGQLCIDVTFERVDPRDHAPQYEWMETSLGRVNGVKDDASYTCSFYRLPIPGFGRIEVGVLTTAMSEPKVVEYTLVVDGSSVPEAAEPTVEPTAEPTVEPTVEPTAEPTAEPSAEPAPEPTPEPVETPIPTPVQPIEPAETAAPADGTDEPAPPDAVILPADLPTDAPPAQSGDFEHPGTPAAPTEPSPVPAPDPAPARGGLTTGAKIAIAAAAVVVAAAVVAIIATQAKKKRTK